MGGDVSMIGGGSKREWPDVMRPDGDGKGSSLNRPNPMPGERKGGGKDTSI